MLRPATRVDVRQVMEQERAEFVRLLGSLSEEDASTPTACEGWSVRDLAVHLLGDDLSFLSRNRDAHRNESRGAGSAGPQERTGAGSAGPQERTGAGSAGPQERTGAGSAGPQDQNDSTPEWDSFVEELDALNNRWVEAGRFLSTRLLAELLEITGRMVAEFLEAVDSNAPGEVVSWAGPDPAPWWMVGAREFTERWVHHQQIRDALGQPGLNGPSFVAPILATAMHGVPRAYDGVDASEDTTVAIDVTGRAGYSWAVRRAADGWKLYEGLTREAATRLSLDQETAWRFLMGMLSARQANSRVTVEGEKNYARPFFSAVSAIVRRT